MPIETPSNQPAEWLSLPVIATIARFTVPGADPTKRISPFGKQDP